MDDDTILGGPAAPARGRIRTLAVDRRSVLIGTVLLALAPGRIHAAPATGRDAPWINVNLQGLEGGSAVPGREGTDYFAATADDLRYVAARTTGPCRLPFRWERMQARLGGPLDETYLGKVASVADAAAALGRGVILDCHNYMRRQVEGTSRVVGDRDGVVTATHLADLWHRLASRLGDHPGVAGWDLMNEPHDLGGGQPLAPIIQASVDAVDAAETKKMIVVEGDRWSSAEHWVSANSGYPLHDPNDRITYSAHCYPDPDGSGTHFDYAALAQAGLPDTVLADRTRAFASWCAAHRLRGNIGETNVGTDDPRWMTVLDRGLTFWRGNGLSVNLWFYGSRFGANPYNLYPVGSIEAPQWRVVAEHLAA